MNTTVRRVIRWAIWPAATAGVALAAAAGFGIVESIAVAAVVVAVWNAGWRYAGQ